MIDAPVELILPLIGLAAVVVAAPAVVAKDNAIAAASEADERWRIAISCVRSMRDNAGQCACRSDGRSGMLGLAQ